MISLGAIAIKKQFIFSHHTRGRERETDRQRRLGAETTNHIEN